MADVKISALPLATTPLAGTEVLPIVQSATTDQVTVANLTAGRAVSAASLTLTTPLAAANGGTGIASLGTGVATALGNSVNGASGIVVEDSNSNISITGTLAMGSSFKRNRIINGDMRIDQRNAGAAVTSDGTNLYCIDRFLARGVAGKYTAQQSSTAPTGFTNSLIITSTSAYSIAAGDINAIRHYIEGFNVADLGFGTASARTITASFWVRSSLTGTFGGALRNGAGNRSYPFTYSITSADTWEYKSITVAGDTTGTWLTNNGIGLEICFGLGCGATFSGTAGSWAGSNFLSATGATSVVGTNGATFYITGVQLEVGSVATPYERQIYSDQLIQCQRYYETNATAGTAPANGVSFCTRQLFGAYSTGNLGASYRFEVAKRTSPTLTFYGGNILGGSTAAVYIGGTWTAMTSQSTVTITTQDFDVDLVKSGAFTTGDAYITQVGWAASAEL